MTKAINAERKIISTIVLLLIGIYNVLGQKQFVVHGKLKSESSKEPIEFATIGVKCFKNDSMITSMITDSKGEFSFEIKPGKYSTSIRCLGYKPVVKIIDVYDQDLLLKTIGLMEENNALEQVNVVGTSYHEQFNRSVQIVTRQFKEGTNNVKDLLSKIRGINVDPLDNSIRVNNEESVLMLVNGVKKEQNYIKNLSPDRVNRIEITRNPTGRYISEGYTSVINIILKKNYAGYDLSLEEKGLYSLDKSNGNDRLFYNQAFADLTYTFKKVNLYGSYSNLKSNTNLFVENTKHLNGNTLIKEAITEKPNSESDKFSHTFLLGTDIFINSKQTLSFETNIMKSPYNQNKTNRSYTNIFSSEDNYEMFVSALSSNQSDKEFYSQLSYRNKFSDKNKMELDYSYNKTKSELGNTYVEDVEMETEQKLNSKRKTSIIDLNFNHFFNDTYSFEAGYKNTYRIYDYEYFSLTQSGEIEINKDIRNLLYTYFSISSKSKLKTKLGVAVEQNELKTNNQSNYNNSIQPYLSIFYHHSTDINVTLKLNSKSEYPYAEQINPFVITTDRISREIGNPNLNFSTKYTSSLDFKLFKNKLSIEPFYSYTKNHISQTGHDVDNYFEYTYSNLDKYESYGLKMSTHLTLIPKKMFFNLTGSLYNDKTKFEGCTNQITDFTMDSHVMYLSSKHKTLYALMLKRMNAKRIQAYGYYNDNNDYLGCLMKQPFFQRKVAITVLYLLPVSSGLSYSMNNYFEYNAFNEKTRTNIEMLKNLLMLKVSFNLNKGNEIKSIEKKDYKDQKKTKGFF